MTTTLKIEDPAELSPSLRVQQISGTILAFRKGEENSLAAYLDTIELEYEDDSIEDLRLWLPALERVDGLLADFSQLVVTTSSRLDVLDESGDDGVGAKFVLRSVLTFLRALLKRGKEKRCFLSYKVRFQRAKHVRAMSSANLLHLIPSNTVSWCSDQRR